MIAERAFSSQTEESSPAWNFDVEKRIFVKMVSNPIDALAEISINPSSAVLSDRDQTLLPMSLLPSNFMNVVDNNYDSEVVYRLASLVQSGTPVLVWSKRKVPNDPLEAVVGRGNIICPTNNTLRTSYKNEADVVHSVGDRLISLGFHPKMHLYGLGDNTDQDLPSFVAVRDWLEIQTKTKISSARFYKLPSAWYLKIPLLNKIC